jgi:TolA protein
VSYFKKHKEGTILTIVFHALVILILITAGFFTPLPLPEEQGVLVDFGTSNVGQGRVDPAPRPTPEPRQQQAEPVQETTPPPPQPQQPEVIPEPSESSAEELMTQDYEETAAVEEAKKKREEEERKREEEERKRREELEQKRLEDQQRQREEELERRRLAEIEKQKADSIRRIEEQRLAEQRRIAEERRQDSIRKAEEQARIDEINSRTRNAFSGSSGQSTDNNSGGQGTTYQGGNQGSSTGTAGAERYGLGGGEGITYDLTGRSTENLIRPDYNVQEEGVVVVQISVDKMGQVTSANAGVRGSNSLNPDLLDAARRAALSTRFNADPNAPALQTGTITYRFVLN